MPNKKMTFPKVPGDTPRERFINLVRHVITLPKESVKQQNKRIIRRAPFSDEKKDVP